MLYEHEIMKEINDAEDLCDAEEMNDTEETGDRKELEAKEWLCQECTRLEQQQKELEMEKAQFEQQKKDFQMEQNRTADHNRFLKKQLEQEKKLFEMKWKVLEEELVQLAEDKLKIEQERKEYQALKNRQPEKNIHYEMFFVGVNSKLTLKKRYKDLTKIFHPDNLAGDKETLQEINREYDSLKRIFV